MALDLTFGAGGGGGGSSSGDYVKDSFQDTSSAANSNSELTSSASTNPNSQYFANNDAPKYSTKQLFIKGLTLLEDRSKWLNNKPTYEIEWNETFPGVYGYICGDARLISFGNSNGQNVLIRNASDFMGISGNIRNVLWHVNPNAATSATAMRVTDGSDTSTIDFSSAASDSIGRGINHFAAFVHAASNATDDIHDYRLRAVQNDVLAIAGVTVFFENSANNIKIFPGSTYVDKSKVTTTGITAMALPTGDTTTGFASVVYKTSASTYGVTTQAVTALVTGAAGSSGTNSITVTTGTGSSFLPGMGIVAQQGSSMHVANILSISTDTLTLGATLPFALSGATLWRSWAAGTTYTIGSTLFAKAFELDPIYASNPIEVASFGASTSGNYMYSHPNGKFRAWGSLQLTTAYNGIPILKPLGATTGFLQLEGDFQAAEIEWMGLGASSVLHGTFGVNGLLSFGQNQAFTGIIKQTVLADAQNGWNNFVFSPGSSFLDVGITKINMYQLRSPIGPTLGRLMEFRDHAGFAHRSAYNATMMGIGLDQRRYVDEMFLQGAWARSATTAAVGGARFIGTSTNSVLKFQYYGQNFNILGTAGTSSILTLDGSSIAISFNAINSVATLGFHSLQFTCQSGTHLIDAIDIYKPKNEIKSLQNFNPLLQLANIATTFVQSDTPRNAKNGDIWAEVPLTAYTQPKIWVRMFGYWLQVNISNVADDPHFDELYVYGGFDNSAIQAVNQKYNSTSWALSISLPLVRRDSGSSTAQYNGKGYCTSGTDSGALVTTNYSFNKSSWTAETVIPAGRQGGANYTAFGKYHYNRGLSTFATTAATSTASQQYNGSAWISGVSWVNGEAYCGMFLVNSLLSNLGGIDSTGSIVAIHEQKNSADAVSSATAIPQTFSSTGSSNVNIGIGIISQGQAGSASAISYTWNGASWSSSFNAPYTAQAPAGANSVARAVFFGIMGTSGGSNVATNFQYNGVSFQSNSNAVTASKQGTAACI
jgi:hypothetical protein